MSPGPKPVLSEERKKEIAAAFSSWYENQPDKTAAMMRITQHRTMITNDAHTYRTGTRVPLPGMLLVLYEETGDHRFLYTKDEKVRTKRINPRAGPIPPPEEWPDRDDIEMHPHIEKEIDRLRREIKAVTQSIEAFGKMSEDNPKRDHARSRLVGPAMELFQALQHLNLRFPSAFEDLLRQMSLASKLTNPHK